MIIVLIKGVVTVSSGNHGAALAMAVQLRDGKTSCNNAEKHSEC